jgi:putative transposase
LNEGILDSLADARRKTALWRHDDNRVSAHSSRANKPPSAARQTLEQPEG